jgi:SAM-dependent methyltransferase
MALLKLLDRVLGRAAAESTAVQAPPAPAPGQQLRPGSALYVGSQSHYVGLPDYFDGGSPRSLPLYSEDQMTTAVKELRAQIAADDSPSRRAAIATPFGRELRRFAPWYQRIDFPEQGLSSTSDHGLTYFDEGSFNTLNKRLTSEEACILRPQPKWRYLEPVFPAVAGKSVMEIGSANGFFSLKFAERGAAQVTGIEVVRGSCESARWCADALGHRNVRFVNTDFLLDLSLERHDIVFLSEVHNHFLLPFLGLLRLVNLSREALVLDTVSDCVPDHGASLSSGWLTEQKQLIYHVIQFSDGLIVDFLNLVGVPPSRITRYSAPDQPWHNVYVIDTRDLAETRARRRYPEYLRDVIDLKFRNRPLDP